MVPKVQLHNTSTWLSYLIDREAPRAELDNNEAARAWRTDVHSVGEWVVVNYWPVEYSILGEVIYFSRSAPLEAHYDVEIIYFLPTLQERGAYGASGQTYINAVPD